MTPSNERISKGLKKRPTGKIEVNLSPCRHPPASLNIARRAVDDGGTSRKEMFPVCTGKEGFDFLISESPYGLGGKGNARF
jgi:hypothetical protein